MRLVLAGQGEGRSTKRRDKPFHPLLTGRIEQEPGKSEIVFNDQEYPIARLNVIAIVIRLVDQLQRGRRRYGSDLPTARGAVFGLLRRRTAAVVRGLRRRARLASFRRGTFAVARA